MKRVLAIARLTFSEGIRMRIVLVFVVVLLFLMLRLPFALRGDETLAGRLQNFLAYSLNAVSLLLSLATVFLSCATLSGEFRSASLHLVVTKPVTRFQILLGKWLGVNTLNLLLLVLCGTAIYGFARFLKNQPEEFARDRLKLNDVVWTARVAATPVEPNFETVAREDVSRRIADGSLRPDDTERAVAERMKELRNRWLAIAPQHYSRYDFADLPEPGGEQAIQVRFRARGIPIPQEEILHVAWDFVNPMTDESLLPRGPFLTEERSGDLHQFLVSARRLIHDHQAALVVVNPIRPEDRTQIIFEGKDALQILYKVGSFEANYVKALAIIFFRLAFLSAVGLLFSVFVSFPIACLCAFSAYLIGLGWEWWVEAIGANLTLRTDAIDPYGAWGPYIRLVLVPILHVFPNFSRYDGTAQLVDGTYIQPALLLRCAAHTLVFGAGLLLGVGWLVFRRREVAEVTV